MKNHIYKIDEYGVRNYHTHTMALLSIGFLYTVIAVLAAALLAFEQVDPGANISNYADAFWALQMSASTIGFGDFYPVTFGGRMVVALMFYIGVGIVGFIGALIAERVLGFADTNVKNRELRRQNADILEHNIQLEKKLDKMLARLDERG
ncbi:MAG: potassium channel family protein [Gammaproteobacteria bacterium]|jgi:voltage-gated potassium channel|nr:potassium channel family protein [Gammaproteobacteria bacterium]